MDARLSFDVHGSLGVVNSAAQSVGVVLLKKSRQMRGRDALMDKGVGHQDGSRDLTQRSRVVDQESAEQPNEIALGRLWSQTCGEFGLLICLLLLPDAHTSSSSDSSLLSPYIYINI